MDREVIAMRAQLTQLQQEHSRLLFQHSLLAAICDSLAWMRTSKQRTGSGQPLSAGSITADEQLLLEQLAKLSYSSLDRQDSCTPAAAGPTAGDAAQACGASLAGSTAAAASPESAAEAEAAVLHLDSRRSSCDSSDGSSSSSSDSSTVFQVQQQQDLPLSPGEDTIVPHGDLMQLFRRLLSMPSTTHEHLTLTQLQEEYATIVCELSLNLAMLDQPQHLQAACSAEAPAAAIERLVLRHVHQMATLLLQQRDDLLQAFYLSNCLSGAVGAWQPSSPAALHDSCMFLRLSRSVLCFCSARMRSACWHAGTLAYFLVQGALQPTTLLSVFAGASLRVR
jgi:hypothetical protein